MTNVMTKIIGPRMPQRVVGQRRLQYILPTILLGVAAVLLLVSITLPYWQMSFFAPQFPKGLDVMVYVNKLAGNVREVDGLNHYIGMRPLEEAAELERSLSILAIAVVSLLVLGAVLIHTKWAAVLALPAMLYPFIFVADMYYWLYNFGMNLDPTAPFKNVVKPFVPPIMGEVQVANFRIVTSLDSGFYLAVLASLLVIAGLYFHRKAYKPLLQVQTES